MKLLNSKLICFFVAIMLVSSVNAATYYRDRFIPGGVCMIEFEGKSINANLIQKIEVGTYRGEGEYQGFFAGVKYPEFLALGVQLVNGTMYYYRNTDQNVLEMRKIGLLQLIKDTCR